MAANELGRKISGLLLEHNISQRELARKVGITEVSMSRYMNGERKPRELILEQIARNLQTTPEYLLGKEPVDEDSEIAFYRTQRDIARNAKKWTNRQKITLMSTLFGED